MIDINNQTPLLLGIGGSGMSSIAHILLDIPVTVYGTEKNLNSSQVQILRKRRAVITDESNVDLDKIDYGIYSSAIDKDNHPIYNLLLKNHKTLLHRSQVLHILFSKKRSISVTGSHGKTSTTAMIGYILHCTQNQPAVMVGGEVSFLNERGGTFGNGKWGVYESDESDGTFLNHDADIKVVTNIDNDHLDYFKTRENLVSSFTYFLQKSNSKCIVNTDDAGIAEAIAGISDKSNLVGFGQKGNAHKLKNFIDIYIQNDELKFTWLDDSYTIQVPYLGEHYLLNAFSATIASQFAGVSVQDSISSLKSYPGVKRRLEYLGQTQEKTLVYDDYAHHPTEIQAVLNSIHKMKTRANSRSIAIFQPHRYTRTKNLYKEFAQALEKCDLLYLLPIYSAGESPIDSVSIDLIYNLVSKPKKFLLTGNIQKDILLMKSDLRENDYLISIGAGNVRDWALTLVR